VQHLGRFIWQFQRYLNHPALLGWTFGEQMNLPANGYLQAFNDKHQCSWWDADSNAQPGGCFNNLDVKSACAGPIACVYNNFFAFINQAAAYAKNVMRARMQQDVADGGGQAHLIFGALSDVDVAWMRMAQFNYAVPDIDAWGLQIYRGKDFGQGKDDFLTNYEHTAKSYNARGEKVGTPKPLVVIEYGIDAYNDPCGKGYDSVRQATQNTMQYATPFHGLVRNNGAQLLFLSFVLCFLVCSCSPATTTSSRPPTVVSAKTRTVKPNGDCRWQRC
jgi:hypothetical protein